MCLMKNKNQSFVKTQVIPKPVNQETREIEKLKYIYYRHITK